MKPKLLLLHEKIIMMLVSFCVVETSSRLESLGLVHAAGASSCRLMEASPRVPRGRACGPAARVGGESRRREGGACVRAARRCRVAPGAIASKTGFVDADDILCRERARLQNDC